MAEGLVEAGGRVHCLDRLPEPPKAFQEAQARANSSNDAGLRYHAVDVTHDEAIQKCIQDIADQKQRLDGLIAGGTTPTFSNHHKPTNLLYSRSSPTSHPSPRLPKRRHCKNTRRKLHRCLPDRPRMCPPNAALQNSRLNLPRRLHERYHCKPGFPSPRVQLLKSSSRPTSTQLGNGGGKKERRRVWWNSGQFAESWAYYYANGSGEFRCGRGGSERVGE